MGQILTFGTGGAVLRCTSSSIEKRRLPSAAAGEVERPAGGAVVDAVAALRRVVPVQGPRYPVWTSLTPCSPQGSTPIPSSICIAPARGGTAGGSSRISSTPDARP